MSDWQVAEQVSVASDTMLLPPSTGPAILHFARRVLLL